MTKILIDCVADLHGNRPKWQEGADILIVAGDISGDHMDQIEFRETLDHIASAPHKHKIVIAGNHDHFFEQGYMGPQHLQWTYLHDTGCQVMGLKVWGSPWTLPFCNWYFEAQPCVIGRYWDRIPEDTDILVTHSPPFGIGDRTDRGMRAGCANLAKRVEEIKPRLHVFGHIHEGYGKMTRSGTTYVNASLVTANYRPINKIQRISLGRKDDNETE